MYGLEILCCVGKLLTGTVRIADPAHDGVLLGHLLLALVVAVEIALVMSWHRRTPQAELILLRFCDVSEVFSVCGNCSAMLLAVAAHSGQVLQGAVPLQRIYHSLDRLLEFWGIELVLIVRPPAMPEFLPAVAEVDSHMAYRAQRRILGLVQLGIEKTRLLNGSGPQYRKHLRNDSFFR